MRKLLENYQEVVLGGIALIFVAIIAVFYFWGLRAALGAAAKSFFLQPAGQTTDLDIDWDAADWAMGNAPVSPADPSASSDDSE